MSINATETVLPTVLAYAARGWRVFPCHSFIDGVCTCDNPQCSDPAKHPLTPNGHLGATLDPELVRAWHSETDGLCNWGLATGSGVWVLDVDGETGASTLARLEREHGSLPLSPTSRTGKGKHVYFAHAEGVRNRTRFAPGLDTRGEGGYVLLPPSLHANGRRYEWLVPPDTPLADAPPWLLAMVRGMTLTVGMGTPDLSNSPGVGEGVRNATLCRLAGVHVARGETLDAVEASALAWAGRCAPPYPERDALRTVRELWRKHQQHTPTAPSPAARRIPQTADREASADCGLRNAACGPDSECGMRSAACGRPMPLPELIAQVRAIGGRFRRCGGVVVVEANAVPDDLAHATAHQQAGLLSLIAEPTPSPYADAAGVIKAVYAKHGQVVKDDAGECALRLPEPDAELEAAFQRLYAEVCGEFLSEVAYFGALEAMR